MKNEQNKQKILDLIHESNHVEAFEKLEQAITENYSETGRHFEIHPKLTFHIIQAWIDAKQPKFARKAKDLISEMPYCEAHLENLEQAIGDLEETERLGASVYPPYIELKRRWHTPRLAQQTYNQKKLLCWYPGFAVRGIRKESEFIYAAWVINDKLCPSHYLIESWIKQGGQLPDYNEKQYIEFSIYEGGSYGTCRIWTDPYWQHLQAVELKKLKNR